MTDTRVATNYEWVEVNAEVRILLTCEDGVEIHIEPQSAPLWLMPQDFVPNQVVEVIRP